MVACLHVYVHKQVKLYIVAVDSVSNALRYVPRKHVFFNT